ncbi:MAG: sugar ABC transporter substrate-binding protein, partial [Hungatella sp.]
GQKDFENRITGDRGKRPIDPPIMANEEESEELNLIKTPLMDFVKTMTLKFITGQASVETDWDTYVAECNNFNVAAYVDLANEIFARTRGILGY